MTNLLAIAQRQYQSFSVLIPPCLCVSLFMYPNLSLLLIIYLYVPLSMPTYPCLSIYQRHQIPWATLRNWGNDIKQDYVRKREAFNPDASFHHQMAQHMMAQSKTLAEMKIKQEELIVEVQQLKSVENRRSIDDESFRNSVIHGMTQLTPTKRRGPPRSPCASTATFQVTILISILMYHNPPISIYFYVIILHTVQDEASATVPWTDAVRGTVPDAVSWTDAVQGTVAEASSWTVCKIMT
jgi:hypothetical protein